MRKIKHYLHFYPVNYHTIQLSLNLVLNHYISKDFATILLKSSYITSISIIYLGSYDDMWEWVLGSRELMLPRDGQIREPEAPSCIMGWGGGEETQKESFLSFQAEKKFGGIFVLIGLQDSLASTAINKISLCGHISCLVYLGEDFHLKKSFWYQSVLSINNLYFSIYMIPALQYSL